MATNANALATFADAKARFGYADSEQTNVEGLINTASARIELYTKRLLAARTSTYYLDGNGLDKMVMPEWPINTITTIHIDDERVFGTDTLIASTDYYLDAENGIIELYEDTFSTEGERRVVKIVGNFGYATTHLKYPVLQAACLEYVDWLKTRYASSGSIGKKGEYSADRVSISYETDMPMHVKSAVDDFVRHDA